MNKKIVLLLFSIIILGILVLILYNNNVNFSAKKINFNFVSKNIKNFVANNKGKNGIYLYENGEKVFFLYLNDYNVEQGTEALYFTDVKIEEKADSVIINIYEKGTYDYNNKKLNNSLLYKVKKGKNVQSIKVYKNNKTVPIAITFGN